MTILALLAVGGWRVSTGAVSPGDLVQAMSLFTLLAFPMRVVGFLLEEMPRSVVALDRIDEGNFGLCEVCHDPVERERIAVKKVRPDGRKADEIRPISIETGYLPRAHGSALFTRGETQALVAATLGTKSDEQKIDALIGEPVEGLVTHADRRERERGQPRWHRRRERRAQEARGWRVTSYQKCSDRLEIHYSPRETEERHVRRLGSR